MENNEIQNNLLLVLGMNTVLVHNNIILYRLPG